MTVKIICFSRVQMSTIWFTICLTTRLQTTWLSLITAGDKYCVGSKGWLALQVFFVLFLIMAVKSEDYLC